MRSSVMRLNFIEELTFILSESGAADESKDLQLLFVNP